MIQISNVFRSELDKQIRNAGHCKINLVLASDPTYQIDESIIKSVEIRTTGDPLGRSLPVEQCIVALADYERQWDPANPNSMFNKVYAWDRMEVAFGIEKSQESTEPRVQIEWTDGMHFRLKEKPKWSNYIVTLTFVSALSFMTKTITGVSDGVANLEQFVQAVAFGDVETGFDPYNLDGIDLSDRLETIPIIDNTTVEKISAADALLSVSVASYNCLKTKPDGIIAIKDYFLTDAELNPSIIKKDDMMEIPELDRLPQVRNIIATYYDNPSVAPAREYVWFQGEYDIDFPVNTDFAYWSFPKNFAGHSFREEEYTNIEDISYEIFRDHMIVTYLQRTDPNAPFYFTGSGVEIKPTEGKITYLGAAQGYEDEEISNPLFNQKNCVQFFPVQSYRHNYLSKTRDMYTIQYRGDPSIDALDIIRVDLDGYGIVPCIVVDRTFRYENGFSGTLSVRRIDNPATTQIQKTAISDLAVSDWAVSDEA